MGLTLSNRQDGYGFFYGTFRAGETSHNVNVLPPKPEWCGDFILEGYEPHDTDWILYADGEEVARVHRREDLETISAHLLAR